MDYKKKKKKEDMHIIIAPKKVKWCSHLIMLNALSDNKRIEDIVPELLSS